MGSMLSVLRRTGVAAALFLGGACATGATSADRSPAPEPSVPFTASSPGGLATPGGALTTASAH
ncbi:MAG: hypothetical protein AAGJ87_10095, partial [Pseudomonadota bacterium]